jgi:peptidoglycan/LPS O-acetylase OafA/YrhL
MPTFWLSQFAPSGVHPSYFVLTAFFLHGWHPYTFNSIVPGGWSIAVEMTFYVFFPLIFHYLGLSLKWTIAAVLFAVFYVKMVSDADLWLRDHFLKGIPDGIWGFFTNLWFPAQLPVFLIGFFAYHLLCNDSIRTLVTNRFWAGCLLCFCAMILLSIIWGDSGFIPNYLLIVLTLAGIIISISGGRLSWLVNPAICYIGKISYSCYLVHGAALGITLKLLGIHLTADLTYFDTGHSFSNLLLFGKIIIIALILTVVISTITLHFIENPGIALGRKIIQRISALSAIK